MPAAAQRSLPTLARTHVSRHVDGGFDNVLKRDLKPLELRIFDCEERDPPFVSVGGVSSAACWSSLRPMWARRLFAGSSAVSFSAIDSSASSRGSGDERGRQRPARRMELFASCGIAFWDKTSA